jgi:hypothetical protein
MDNIEDMIVANSRGEDEELKSIVPGEPSLLELARATFCGRSKWLVWAGVAIGVIATATLVLSGVRLAASETERQIITWSVCLLASMLVIHGVKIWYWMELNKLAVLHEVRNLERTVAILDRRLRNESK